MSESPPEIVIILNPASGRGNGQKQRSRLEKWLAEEKIGARIETTSRAGQATELARQAARNGAKIVVAAGGDGTLGEVFNGIFGTQSHLAVLPLGTGNDFARTLGIGADLEKALQVLKHGAARPIDAGKVEIGGQSRYFLNIAGAGFDSLCAARINEHRPQILSKLSGTAAYLVAVLAELGCYQLRDLRLLIDGKTIETPAALCAVANARSYGGGMNVAPDAELDDGFFDVCLIKDVSRFEFLRAFPGVFSGKHVHHPKVEMFRAKTVLLESEKPLPVLVDGEIMGNAPASFEIVPRAVQILAPPPRIELPES